MTSCRFPLCVRPRSKSVNWFVMNVSVFLDHGMYSHCTILYMCVLFCVHQRRILCSTFHGHFRSLKKGDTHEEEPLGESSQENADANESVHNEPDG